MTSTASWRPPLPDTSTPVLILRSAHHGGLAVARTLGRMGVAVAVLDPDPRTPAFASRYCRAQHVWDLDRAPVDKSISYLIGIARNLGRPAVLIPTTDRAALFVAEHAAELRRFFLFRDLPHDQVQ